MRRSVGYGFIVLVVVASLALASCTLPVPEGQIPTRSQPGSLDDQMPKVPSKATAGSNLIVPQQPSESDATGKGGSLLPPPKSTQILAPVNKSRYVLQPGTPAGVSNFLRADAGCRYLGVGGQVFSRDGQPVTGLIAQVGGTIEGRTVMGLSMTGITPELGPGGYEIYLLDRPVKTHDTLMVQLFDTRGNPLSPRIKFDTVDNCNQNLVLVNFNEILVSYQFFLPSLKR